MFLCGPNISVLCVFYGNVNLVYSVRKGNHSLGYRLVSGKVSAAKSKFFVKNVFHIFSRYKHLDQLHI